MILKINRNTIVIFDLDDTLYKEIDFLYSAFREISKLVNSKNSSKAYNAMLKVYYGGGNVFKYLENTYPNNKLKRNDYLQVYRKHFPKIQVGYHAGVFLDKLKHLEIKIGLITDGRSLTQRNKIAALSLVDCFHSVVISEEFGSEKPCADNFLHFKKKYPGCNFIYIGDNTQKDFIIPNKLGWRSICVIDDGKNIHSQDFSLPVNFLPSDVIIDFNDIELSL